MKIVILLLTSSLVFAESRFRLNDAQEREKEPDSEMPTSVGRRKEQKTRWVWRSHDAQEREKEPDSKMTTSVNGKQEKKANSGNHTSVIGRPRKQEKKTKKKKMHFSAIEKAEMLSRLQGYGNSGPAKIDKIAGTGPTKVPKSKPKPTPPVLSCPEEYPEAFSNGRRCCKHKKEGVTSDKDDELCNGGPISVTSTCCQDDEFKDCAYASCTSYIQACPEDYRHAYMNGIRCCKYDQEDVKFGNEFCDGSAIEITSTCCKDGKFRDCPYHSCEDYVSVPKEKVYTTTTTTTRGRVRSRSNAKSRKSKGKSKVSNRKAKSGSKARQRNSKVSNTKAKSGSKARSRNSKVSNKIAKPSINRSIKKLRETKVNGRIGRDAFDRLMEDCPTYIMLWDHVIGQVKPGWNVSVPQYPIIFNVTPTVYMSAEYAIKFDVFPSAQSGDLALSLRSNDKTEVAIVEFTGKHGKYKVRFRGKLLHETTGYPSSGKFSRKSYDKNKYIKIRIVQFKHDKVVRHQTFINGRLVWNFDIVKSKVYRTDISTFSFDVKPEIGKRPSLRGFVIGSCTTIDDQMTT